MNDVPVYIYPADLLSQKTALFGMTRTGKSNTTKIIAMTVYRLRCPKEQSDSPLKIGQLIFDPNGEYANENVQDNNTALKNVWQVIPNIPEDDKKNEITTYGISKHPNDPDRKLMLLNFYADPNLQIGKEIINNLFNHEDPIYIKNFVQLIFDSPDPNDKSAVTRHKRRVLTYRAILNKAGFKAPANLKPSTVGLFSKELIKYLQESEGKDKSLYIAAANVLDNDNPSWGEITTALETLNTFIISKDSGYKEFENWYVTERNGASGNYWADEDLKKLLGIFQYPNGVRRIGQANKQHTSTHDSDFADDIYEDLIKGKLVIIDQSSGDPPLNDSSARRIMTKIFESNKSEFTTGNTPPDIMVYIEEAHNLLPPDNEKNYKDIWVRVAKEGAKLRIGLVYATQEVSSIQKNILKNTANWFIAHLNNTDETKELCKYYDFIDFEPSIRRAQDKGFLRVKTLSNLFVIPVQVDKFTLHSTS